MPAAGREPYYAQFGWVSSAADQAPPADAEWRADRDVLTHNQPVTLAWSSPAGVRYVLEVALDQNYMFTITQRVENASGAPVNLFPFGRLRRTGTPQVTDFYILHEGLLGVFDGVLQEVDYKEVKEAKDKLIQKTSTGGWIGITDKYWLAALAPDQKAKVTARFADFADSQTDHFQADFVEEQVMLAPGATTETRSRLFAGAKETALLTDYRDALGITRFDLAIDWGWFEFLTKPIFYALDYFYKYLGNMGLSILLLTVLIKGAFFPLANKSYKAMAKMKEVQPEMMKLRERFGEDKTRLNQETRRGSTRR
jgi:YidC/Oxa1 family membrane protein insertase